MPVNRATHHWVIAQFNHLFHGYTPGFSFAPLDANGERALICLKQLGKDVYNAEFVLLARVRTRTHRPPELLGHTPVLRRGSRDLEEWRRLLDAACVSIGADPSELANLRLNFRGTGVKRSA